MAGMDEPSVILPVEFLATALGWWKTGEKMFWVRTRWRVESAALLSSHGLFDLAPNLSLLTW